MQRILVILGHWLHTVAFAVWFGGMLAIGALVAPTAFAVNRAFAGRVLESVFRELNIVSFFCAGVMLAATWIEWCVRDAAARRLLFVRAVLTAAAFAMALYLGIRLLPIMIHLRSAGAKADFDRLHHVYEAVSQTQFWLLAVGAGLTAFLALPQPGVQALRRSGVRSDPTDPTDPTDVSARTPEHPNTRTPERLNAGAKRQ